MWDEPPKKVVILKSLGRMLKIKDSMALYKDFYRSKGAGGMLYFPEKNTLEWEDVYPFMYMLALFEGLPENREAGPKNGIFPQRQGIVPAAFLRGRGWKYST